MSGARDDPHQASVAANEEHRYHDYKTATCRHPYIVIIVLTEIEKISRHCVLHVILLSNLEDLYNYIIHKNAWLASGYIEFCNNQKDTTQEQFIPKIKLIL